MEQPKAGGVDVTGGWEGTPQLSKPGKDASETAQDVFRESYLPLYFLPACVGTQAFLSSIQVITGMEQAGAPFSNSMSPSRSMRSSP